TTHTVPPTVPPVGWVIATCRVPVGVVLFFTLTDTLTLPVLPLPSRTAAVRVWVPSGTAVVSHGIAYGPLPLPVPLPTVLPPAVSVMVLVPVEPVTHTIAQLAPLTVAPPVGCVTATVSEPVDGGGVTVLDTVTVLVSAWLAFVAVRVFQEYDDVVATCVPSIASL